MLTNKLNLPEPIYNFLKSDYQPKEKQYSVTTILNPTRQIILRRRHNNEINQDCSDLIWAMFGTAFHSILENSKAGENQLQEEYLKQELSCLDPLLEGYYLSGKADLLDVDNKKIIDYKTTSSFKFVKKDFEDYRLQLLIYAWLFTKIGYKVNKGEIVALLRDWNRSKAQFDKDYPQLQVQTIEFKFTKKDFDFIEKYIKDRFLELKKYEDVADDELPECTMEERWATPEIYAIKKIGNKKAIKLHEDKKEAIEHLNNLNAKYNNEYEIEVREPVDGRCENYCSCNQFCSYYKNKYLNKENN